MSELSLFLKTNKKIRENTFFPATSSLLDEGGNPLLWEVRAVTTVEDEQLREECSFFDEKTMRYRLDTNGYMAKFLSLSVVSPNLYNVNLQNSYDVNTPEELLKEMIDDPDEYQAFALFVRKRSDADTTMAERVKSAKN